MDEDKTEYMMKKKQTNVLTQVDEDDPLYEAPPPPPPPPPDPRLQITPNDKYHNIHWKLVWTQKSTKASCHSWIIEVFLFCL